jgi:hypothetical protein
MKTSFLHELLNGISISSTYPNGKSSKRFLPDSSGIYRKSITKSKQGMDTSHIYIKKTVFNEYFFHV